MFYFQIFTKKCVFYLLVMTTLFLTGCLKTKPFTPPSIPQAATYKTQSQPTIFHHAVQRGETLGNIANRYQVDYKQLANWNNIAPPYTIYPGQNLRLKKEATASQVPSSTIRVSYESSNQAEKAEKAARVTRRKPRSYSSKKSNIKKQPNSQLKTTVLYHLVKPNETLFSIAQQYQKDYRQVAGWNNLSSPYTLTVGQRLRILSPPTNTRSSSKKSRTLTTQSATRQNASHTVVAGDTLYSVANTYGNSLADIARWNNLQPPYTLTPGQVLQVAKTAYVQPPQPKMLVSSVVHNTGYHKIVPGDTLYSISRRYGYSVSQLAAWNNLSPPYNNLSVGQTLRVYPPSGIVRKVRYRTGATSSGKYHHVVRGDTLYSISRRYGYSVNQVAAWNRLSPPYTLSVGQRLRVSP
jgi:peptidoglycan endopeptidase LytF